MAANGRIALAATYMNKARRALHAAPTRWGDVFRWLKRAAALRFHAAEVELGLWYMDGVRGRTGRVVLPRSPQRAFQLLRRAGEAGYADAFFGLGYCYDAGIGVVQDERTAMRFYRRALPHAGASAASNLATIYRDRGDRAGQRRWLLRAEALGSTDARVELARVALLPRSRGDARRKAIADMRRLARSKDASKLDAMLVLADAYRLGRGVKKSAMFERQWRKRAAQQLNRHSRSAS